MEEEKKPMGASAGEETTTEQSGKKDGETIENEEVFTPRKKKISWKAILVAAIVLGIIIVIGYVISQNNSDVFSQAKTLYEAGDYDSAYTMMTKIKAGMENNFEFITIYSDCMHQKGLYEEEFKFLFNRGENTPYREGIANLVQTRYDDIMENSSINDETKQKIEKLINDYLEGNKK